MLQASVYESSINQVLIKELNNILTQADYCEDCKLVFEEIKDILVDQDMQVGKSEGMRKGNAK